MNIVELFAGIGSQRRALTNLGVNCKVLKIAEWYIPAILAYDSIHNGERNLREIKDVKIEEIRQELGKFTFSLNGKVPLKKGRIMSMNETLLRNLYIANKRTGNLVSINKVSGSELPENIDLLTYSFPCQDLSNMGALHGYTNGIDKNLVSRSGLLWEVERIIKEKLEARESIPRILLMENVSSLLAKRHKEDFAMWVKSLENTGYSINKHFLMNARDYGVPQNRNRIFMISVYTKDLNKTKIDEVKRILEQDVKLEEMRKLQEYLRISDKGKYYQEALQAQPNDTASRRGIYKKNYYLYGKKRRNAKYCSTITTKQDRHPNSGVIEFQTKRNNYRFLTARETFLLMGFTDKDYEAIENSNFKYNKSRWFFSRDKYYSLAGNSIVVGVLEKVFEQVIKIDKLLSEVKNSGEN